MYTFVYIDVVIRVCFQCINFHIFVQNHPICYRCSEVYIKKTCIVKTVLCDLPRDDITKILLKVALNTITPPSKRTGKYGHIRQVVT